MEGMHTPLPENELGVETVTCCRDLWWTLYIMDRHFSASMGVPMSLQDSDITTPVNPPTQGSPGRQRPQRTGQPVALVGGYPHL